VLSTPPASAGIFTNLIDGRVSVLATPGCLDPPGELLANADIERDGMDAAFAARPPSLSSWSKLTWEARR